MEPIILSTNGFCHGEASLPLVSANFENASRIRAFGLRSYFRTRRDHSGLVLLTGGYAILISTGIGTDSLISGSPSLSTSA